MSDPFVAEIRVFPFNFPPVGWAFCNGQLMSISQNTALFSLLGTTYGGDGKSNFALPNLQGQVPMQPGQGPGLSDYFLGESGGYPNVTLGDREAGTHVHNLQADIFDPADAQVVSQNSVFAQSTGGTLYQNGYDVMLSPQAISVAGGGQPHNNMQPYLTLNFCIALQGIYPPRS